MSPTATTKKDDENIIIGPDEAEQAEPETADSLRARVGAISDENLSAVLGGLIDKTFGPAKARKP